jgi:hypothetical protein
VTDWFKKNPFLAALSAVAAVLLVAGVYFLFAEMGRLSEEQSSFDQKKAQLQRLQRNKPYPSEANVEATRKETEEAAALLQELAKELAVDTPPTTPQAFQDELAGMVKDIAEKAAAQKIGLPENFYLGFEQYETQLPSAGIAPRLSSQLRSIHAVALVLLKSQIKSLGSIVRAPVLGETGSEAVQEESGEDGKKKRESEAPELEMVPFDVAFNADQSAFRTAFNRISELQPPVFVRLVAIENSSPLPPSKTADPEASDAQAEQPAPQSGIRPVVGRETVNVSLRLASVVAFKPSSP